MTAEDVKWSLDRAVSAKSLAAPQLSTGSLTSADQFKIVDAHTRDGDAWTSRTGWRSPICACCYCDHDQQQAGASSTPPRHDPWAMEWMKTNTAASGAYIVESHKPGESTILRRNEAWKGGVDGALPFFRRVILQTVPEPATRANLVERGDADLSIDLAASDMPTMERSAKVKVASIPQTNGFTHITLNTQMAPFDNVKVRQAVAAALPYEDMFKAAIFGRGRQAVRRRPGPARRRTQASRSRCPSRPTWRAPRQLLAEAGMPNGFSTDFAFSAGQSATAEPMAALVKESLGKIGIQVDIQKKPDAEFNTLEADKKLPFYTDGGDGLAAVHLLLLLPVLHPRPALELLRLEERRDGEADAGRALPDRPGGLRGGLHEDDRAVRGQEPLVMLWQPNQDAVMAKSVDGYTYQFYRQADFRDLKRV